MIFSTAALIGQAQDVAPQIDKAAKHPKREENAAKADVRRMPKVIFDSSSFAQPASKPLPAPASKNKSGRRKGNRS